MHYQLAVGLKYGEPLPAKGHWLATEPGCLSLLAQICRRGQTNLLATGRFPLRKVVPCQGLADNGGCKRAKLMGVDLTTNVKYLQLV